MCSLYLYILLFNRAPWKNSVSEWFTLYKYIWNKIDKSITMLSLLCMFQRVFPYYLLLVYCQSITVMSHEHHGVWNHWQFYCIFHCSLRLETSKIQTLNSHITVFMKGIHLWLVFTLSVGTRHNQMLIWSFLCDIKDYIYRGIVTTEENQFKPSELNVIIPHSDITWQYFQIISHKDRRQTGLRAWQISLSEWSIKLASGGSLSVCLGKMAVSWCETFLINDSFLEVMACCLLPSHFHKKRLTYC